LAVFSIEIQYGLVNSLKISAALTDLPPVAELELLELAGLLLPPQALSARAATTAATDARVATRRGLHQARTLFIANSSSPSHTLLPMHTRPQSLATPRYVFYHG